MLLKILNFTVIMLEKYTLKFAITFTILTKDNFNISNSINDNVFGNLREEWVETACNLPVSTLLCLVIAFFFSNSV